MKTLSEISLMQFNDFKKYFEEKQIEDKSEEKEDGLNIFQWALCQMNYEAVRFLMDYGYDLERELDTVIMKSMTLNKVLPVISLFKETHGVLSKKIKTADFDNYQKIIELCNKEKIIFEAVSREDIKKANVKDYQKVNFITNQEYLVALINNCFDDDILLGFIDLCLRKNINDVSVFNETLKKLRDNDSFILDFLEYSKLFIWLSEVKESPIRNNTIRELAQALMRSEEIFDINELKKLMFKDMLFRFNSSPLSKIIDVVNQFDSNSNVPDICFNHELISDILSNMEKKEQQIILPLRHSLKRYSEIVEIKPELQKNNEILALLNEKMYYKDYIFNNYNIKDFRYENRNCWVENGNNGNNVYFDIFPDNTKILKLLENKKNKAIDLFFNSLFYTYLQLAEDIKIDRLFKKSKHISLSEANYDYNTADIHEKLAENLSVNFNKGLFKENVQVIFNSTYNSNYITSKDDFEDNSNRIIKYIFNSKLTLSETEEEIKKVSFDKNVSLQKIISDYLMEEKELRNLSFLYNEANSMEKIALLKANGIAEPLIYNSVNVLHNLSMNEDEVYKKVILTKNINITENDLLVFLRNIGVWSYSAGKTGCVYEFLAHSFGATDLLNELFTNENSYAVIENAENLSDLLAAIETKSNLLQENAFDDNGKEILFSNQIPVSVVIANYEKYLINKTVQINPQIVLDKKIGRI